MIEKEWKGEILSMAIMIAITGFTLTVIFLIVAFVPYPDKGSIAHTIQASLGM